MGNNTFKVNLKGGEIVNNSTWESFTQPAPDRNSSSGQQFFPSKGGV